MSTSESEDLRLEADACRWTCDAAALGFETTSDLTPTNRIMGQEDAVEALRFGLKNRYHGDNIFVRGLSGFGRMALIDQAISEIAAGTIETPDRCYIHNFEAADRPLLLELPTGRGREFRHAMDEFADFVQTELPAYLGSDIVKSKQRQFLSASQQEIQQLGAPLEEELRNAGLTLVPMQVGQNIIPAIMPVKDGKPVNYEELQRMRLEGEMSEPEFKALTDKIAGFEKHYAELGEKVSSVQVRQQQEMQQLMASEARSYVGARLAEVRKRFALPQVTAFLDRILEDLINHRLQNGEATMEFARLYRVNLVNSHGANERVPVVTINNPTLVNLLGTIETELMPGTTYSRSDHLMVKPGALLEADGGFLVIEAREILVEPGAWSLLLRTLKTGQFDMTNLDPMGFWPVPRLKPQAIPVDIKVILVGDPETHYLLEAHEPRFPGLFKILADFSDTVGRDEEGFATYANMLARLVKRDDLLPFHCGAVARLIEHGARICAQPGCLTSRFSRIADLAREAAFIAAEAGNEIVRGDDVTASIARTRRRADLPVRRFRRLITRGTLKIAVDGQATGEINGLAVTSAGPIVYGFPARITATIGPGNAGMINIERESDLSGAIHTKGFMIISGLLRQMLELNHPMAFSSSIAFEQSYGGIDGDSASGAEFCCLLSALTGFPLRQDIAMTGAVDQKGNILPIGAVTEKVEGFYDTCRGVGFTGTQGVIIPATNAGELMLRPDVVAAITAGEFSVYAVDRIEQALELFMGKPFGSESDHGGGETILQAARNKAHDYWQIASRKN